VLGDRGGDDGSLGFRRQPGQPQENNPSRESAKTEYKLAEVFVRCHEKAPMLRCCLKDIVIVDAWIHLGNIHDRMTVLAKTFHDLPVDAFVN
jgi:hypothetical protein